ncbi:MAG: carboxypeptidase-like regulatory domain-containing protein [Chitinophagaceae bacterium]|nr:carboxypeptidase-like regulatory domain-containing protein [Chitinophagaceae bacterium]
MRTLLLICLLMTGNILLAQKIHGHVTDEDGKALPFATILVKGTKLGATANAEGFYTLNLMPGSYTIECRYVGYTTREKKTEIGSEDRTLNFTLSIQALQLDEVFITMSGEDPAYEIIRKAIRMRPVYESEVSKFSADVYIKGTLKIISFPDRILGKKIPEEDRAEMMLDSAGQGIIYLSESLTHVSVEKPDKLKMDVISSRVSGSNSFGFDFPIFLDFNKNNVNISNNVLNKRGFVSPIADNALNFYRYKLLGSFVENGKKVHTIQITPRRKYEPLFSGIVSITDEDWRFFSCDLLLTKESQMELLDSLQISQIHTPVDGNILRVRNQVISFRGGQFGVVMGGSFVNVYSNYDIAPEFDKKFFGKVLIAYDSTTQKKSDAYWDTIRPIPLEQVEINDYRVKDSAQLVRDSLRKANQDSLLLRNMKPVTVKGIFLNGVNKSFKSGNGYLNIRNSGLIYQVQYNTVEGLNVNPSITFRKSSPGAKRQLSIITDLRYGFKNKHFNPWGGFVLTNRGAMSESSFYNNYQIFAAGGKRVSTFNRKSYPGEEINTVSTLLYGWNDLKLYENYFFKAGYRQMRDNGNSFLIEALYEDRIPVDNSTDYIFAKKYKDRLTPNYPVEVLTQQFTPHKAVILHAAFSFQPGQKYIQYPKYRMRLGSKYPTFTVHYYKGIPNLLNSDVNYDRWNFSVNDELDMKLAGSLKYYLGTGGFLNKKNAFIQDYQHFNGNTYHIASEYVRSFQAVRYYRFSSTPSFFTELHLEHHSQGMFTNKIPLFRKLNWHLVEGVNALYLTPKTGYMEVFAGLENIFKFLRVDAVMSMQNGYKPVFTYRIGFNGLFGDAITFSRPNSGPKIINNW